MTGKRFTAKDIPSQALHDLKKIAVLEESLFDLFLGATDEAGPALTSNQFATKILAKIPALKGKDVGPMIRAVFFLYPRMTTPQKMAQIVLSSPYWATVKDFSQENKETLSNRLIKLLSCPKSIGVSSKALEVMMRHDSIFCKARILSDIRPVFSGAPETADAAVIIHNLEIGFHRNGEHQDFYVALDTRDLQNLKVAIDRAQKKAVALESILSKSSLPYLGTEL